MPSQKMPLRHSDYFELKTIKKPADTGRTLYPPSSCLKAGYTYPFVKVIGIPLAKVLPSPVPGREEQFFPTYHKPY